ncbi:lysoplasmalogenase family protein [Breznakiellaceae bacterium SP9]
MLDPLLLLFAALAVFHLIVLSLGLERLRRISKMLLVPLLLVYYAVQAEHFMPIVAAAGLLGWAGDICLIKYERNLLVMLGLTAFLLGHLCYSTALLHFAGTLAMQPLFIAIGAALILGIWGIRLLRPGKGLLLPSCLYAAALEGMCIAAFFLLYSRRDTLGLVIAAGALCFAASDTILAYFIFRGALPRRGNVAVMLTYIAAQSGIIIGLAAL